MKKIIMQTDSITWTSSLPDIHVRMSRSIMCIPATTTVTVLLTLNVRCSNYNSILVHPKLLDTCFHT